MSTDGTISTAHESQPSPPSDAKPGRAAWWPPAWLRRSAGSSRTRAAADTAAAPPSSAQESRDKAPAASRPEAGHSAAGPDTVRSGNEKASTRLQQRTEPEIREALARALNNCRRGLVHVGAFSLAINLLILVVPIYLFQISDRVLTSRSTDTLIMLSIFVVGALAVHSLLDMARRLLLMRIAVQVETGLGAPVLSAATKAAQHGSAREFQAVLDLDQLRHFLTGPVVLTMFDSPIAPIYFLAVYLIHWQLGVIVTLAALALVTLALINQRVTAVPFSRASAFSMRANQQTEAMARNAQIVNALGMIREGVALWGRETAESLKSQVAAQDLNVLISSFSKFVRLCAQIGMLGWGAWLALSAEVTAGTMIAASIIASRALAPVEGLIDGWRSFVQARGAYYRIRTLLTSSPLNLERLRLPRPQGRLMVERVLYVPPPTKKVILNGVNFALEPGESLAIVGSSGTGKSTLARMLVGSLTPTSGSVRLDMMDIRNWDPRQLGETVGYLPQDVELFPGSIKSNIARMREDVSDEAIFDAAELAGIHELISEMPQGYETPIAIDGSPLSGGQKQRVALARAFFGCPRLVVLDEPNSNLDGRGEIALAAALRRAKERSITVVAVTQRPTLLKSVDKIMMLNEGRIQSLGSREDILPKLIARSTPTEVAV